MVGVTLVSYVVLTHFMKHKYERWDQKSLGDPNQKPTSLEEEYEKMTKKIDLSNWENKSVPGRDYEQSPTQQQQQQQQQQQSPKN
eukprot:gene1120-1425_t